MGGRERIGADRNGRIWLILAKVWFWFVSEHVTRYCRGACFISHDGFTKKTENRTEQNKVFISDVVLFCVMICLKMLKQRDVGGYSGSAVSNNLASIR